MVGGPFKMAQPQIYIVMAQPSMYKNIDKIMVEIFLSLNGYCPIQYLYWKREMVVYYTH